MNRQLYANGGIMTVAPREKFGLGSSLKKFVRKIIPNEISAIAVKAAPFVAPFNPALAAGMAGIGGFDQTGRIGSSLKSAALTYGGGQAARYAGGAGFQGNPFTDGGAFRGGLEGFKGGFSSPFGTKTGFGKMLSGTEDVSAIKGLDQGITADAASVSSKVNPNDMQNYLIDQSNYLGGAENVAGNAVTNAGSIVNNAITKAPDKGFFTDFMTAFRSGNGNQIASEVMKIGGKGLKAVFTNPHPTIEGKTVLDKTAMLSALVAVPSYLEAKALADEAGLTDEEFNEDLYNAEKADYMTKYQENLPYENFGITAAKNGGRIGFESGSSPIRDMAMEMNSGRGPITKMDYISLYEMAGYNNDVATSLGTEHYKTGRSQDSKTSGLKDGGRINFAFGSPKDKTMFEELNVDTIYRPDNKPSVLEETLEDDKMVSLNSSRLTQLMQALEEAEAKNDMDMIVQIKFDIDKEMKKYAKGGRVNRMFGSPEEGEGITTIDVDMEMEEEPKGNMMMAYEPGDFTSAQKTYMYRRLTAMGGSDRSITVPDLYKVFKNPGKYPADEAVIRAILDANNKKDGGRIGFEDGTNEWITKKKKNWITKKSDKVEKKEKGGIMGMEVPVRKNQGGVSELDYRNTGGFVPVGVKERADDVPAMLSKNEFVFTADAVRNAGDGNINKGAQKMYNMMKNLENGGTLA